MGREQLKETFQLIRFVLPEQLSLASKISSSLQLTVQVIWEMTDSVAL